MKTGTSSKEVSKGNVANLKWTFDLDKAIAKHGKDRVEELMAQWAVAHPFASAVKAAYDVPEKASERVVKEAAEIRKAVEDGATFDLVEYFPRPKGVDKVVLSIRENWEKSSKKEKFLMVHGLDPALKDADAEMVELAYLERKALLADADLA
jgi:hypothetical protein